MPKDNSKFDDKYIAEKSNTLASIPDETQRIIDNSAEASTSTESEYGPAESATDTNTEIKKEKAPIKTEIYGTAKPEFVILRGKVIRDQS